jgi:hypothetical protein
MFLAAGISLALTIFISSVAVFTFRLPNVAAAISPLLFWIAAVLVFFKPQLGYILALIACVLFLAWPVIIHPANFENAWTIFKEDIEDFGGQNPYHFLKIITLEIISVALVSAAAISAALRLIPARAFPDGMAVGQSIWPAFAGSLLVLGAWFAFTVMPYRLPHIVDAGPSELRILHVQKHGLAFRETTVVMWQDGKFFSSMTDRRLFHYKIQKTTVHGIVPLRRGRVQALWHNRPHSGRCTRLPHTGFGPGTPKIGTSF